MKKLTQLERTEIARRLSVLDRDAILGVEELAVLFNTTVARIYQASSPLRQSQCGMTLQLPEKVLINGRRACWLHGQVRDAIAQLAARPAPTKAPPQEQATQSGPGPEATESAPKPIPSKARMGRKRKAT